MGGVIKGILIDYSQYTGYYTEANQIDYTNTTQDILIFSAIIQIYLQPVVIRIYHNNSDGIEVAYFQELTNNERSTSQVQYLLNPGDRIVLNNVSPSMSYVSRYYTVPLKFKN